MSEKIGFKTIWHEAGINALVLTALCMAYTLIVNALTGVSQASWARIVSNLLMAAKIAGCIMLVRHYMFKFKAAHSDAQRGDVRRYGTVLCLLSAFVLSALQMAYLIWNPETVQQAIDTVMSTMAQSLDRNQLNAIDEIMGKLPQLTFFGNLVYCSLWAVILPSILASQVVSDNPFDEDEEDE